MTCLSPAGFGELVAPGEGAGAVFRNARNVEAFLGGLERGSEIYWAMLGRGQGNWRCQQNKFFPRGVVNMGYLSGYGPCASD